MERRGRDKHRNMHGGFMGTDNGGELTVEEGGGQGKGKLWGKTWEYF